MNKSKVKQRQSKGSTNSNGLPFFQLKEGPSNSTILPFFSLNLQKKGQEEDLENPYLLLLDAKAIAAVRKKVLEPLKKRSTSFSAVLRTLGVLEAEAMLTDEPFWTEVRKIFKGRALWAVYSILYRTAYFRGRYKEPDLRLSVTMNTSRATEFLDALALLIRRYRPDGYYAILKEAASHVFKGKPILSRIINLIDNRKKPGLVERLTVKARQVHYERNEEGDYEMKLYGQRKRKLIVYESGNELRVIIRIRFVDGKDRKFPFYFFKNKQVPDRWLNTIKAHWNDKFVLDNGVKKLKFTVAPMFFYEDSSPADKQVRVLKTLDEKCRENSTPGRANAGCWFEESSDETIAHEFGHLLGAADEYNLPGSIAEIPKEMRDKLSKTDQELVTVEGITGKKKKKKEGGYDISGLMGDHDDSTDVFPRYLKRFLFTLNDNLPAGTPKYKLKKK